MGPFTIDPPTWQVGQTIPNVGNYDCSMTPNHVCIDIETIAGSPDDADRWMRQEWLPNPSWKDETIGKRFHEAHAKYLERLELMDKSPILTVCIGTEREMKLWHWIDFPGVSIGQAILERNSNEAAMLRAVRDWLLQCDHETLLIGHHIRDFDLRKLRHRMLTHGLKLPPCLLDRGQPIFDCMREWARFTLSDATFVSLSDILDALGIPNHKLAISGEHVGQLHETGRFETLLTYAILDVVAEYSVFCRLVGMTGN